MMEVSMLVSARSWMAVAVFVAGAAAFGCADSNSPVGPSTGGSGDSGSGSGGGGTVASGSGRLTIELTDTPFADATAVLITFDNISVHRSGGTWEDIDFGNGETERTCDLKKLEGPIDVLGSAMLPAGHYTQIRLNVKSATIHFDNPSASLTACAPSITVPGTQFTTVQVPSGEVKLNREFTLAADAVVNMLLDFDGDQSIRQQGGGRGGGAGVSAPEEGRYSLQPVVSILSVSSQ
jgi:hypothetical protein